MDCVIIDTLHLFLHIGDLLINLLIMDLRRHVVHIDVPFDTPQFKSGRKLLLCLFILCKHVRHNYQYHQLAVIKICYCAGY